MVNKKILIIQTSFIGDVVLATSLIAKINQFFPQSTIDFLLKKGNEELLNGDPKVSKVLTFDKSKSRILELLKLIRIVRKARYDVVVNVHRFLSSGIVTALSNAKETVGFDKNPLSCLFTKKLTHIIGDGKHEIERNQQLIAHLTDNDAAKPYLHLNEKVSRKVEEYKSGEYITISPSSVWYTKQLPKQQWISFLNKSAFKGVIYFLGARSDFATCEFIRKCLNNNLKAVNMCGELSMLESASLMESALMNYMNDSAPLHFSSAVNAPTAAVFCSTIPAFGFGPLAKNSRVIEVKKTLHCRPCGIHGHQSCPESNFSCAREIDVQDFLDALPSNS